MPSKFIISIIVFCLLLAFVTLVVVDPATASLEGSLQSWPSRTPTPGSEPTRPSGGSTPGGGGPPAATSTPDTPSIETPISSPIPASPSPIESTTNAPGKTVAPLTPEESPAKTEQTGACDLPPQIFAKGRIPVRGRIGSTEEVIGYLEDSEVRVIVGRSATAPWWLIQFEPDKQGWVLDSNVTILGYTGYVPVISSDSDSDALNELWNPTPDPGCASVALPGIIEADVEESDELKGEEITVDPGKPTIEPSADEVPRSDDTSIGPTPVINAVESGEQSQTQPPSGNNLTWLLFTGLFLIIVGSLSLIIRRRNS